MNLLIFRHGIAEDIGPDGSDESRRLTEEGIAKTRKGAEGLARIAPHPDAMLTSPLIRAKQTADILGEVLQCQPRVMQSLAYGPASAIARDLRRRRDATVLIVGHEPTLSYLIELLLTGQEPTGIMQMKKAACACIETPLPETGVTGGSKLLWLASPKMLRGLG